MLGKRNFFLFSKIRIVVKKVNLEEKKPFLFFIVLDEEDYKMDCYWTSRSQVSTVSFSRREEYLVNIFENFMWKYAVHWYGDFMGGLCQYIKPDQLAKRFTEIFCSIIRDHD